MKYWIRPDIDNRIKEGSIKAYFETTVAAIRPTEVDLRTPDGPISLPNDFVLAMTGYQPNYELFERLGLPVEDDDACKPTFNEDTLETSLPGVYMAGVACAGRQTSKLFIENTREHGDVIVEGILAKRGSSRGLSCSLAAVLTKRASPQQRRGSPKKPKVDPKPNRATV